MLRSRSSQVPIALHFLLFLGLLPAAALAVVVPSSLEFVEGSTANCFPLTGCADVDRYQQVFDGSEFSGPTVITELRFRRDAGTAGPVSTSFSDVVVGLSTTAAAPDGLSTTFADNQGSDFRVVHSGALTVSSASSGGSPAPFDVSIVLNTPFAYDPSQGNLLLDWTNNGGESYSAIFYDAQNTSGDPVSRVYAPSPGATTGTADSVGLVTEFVTLTGDHACCNTGGIGCLDAAIQAAVCAQDTFCCNSSWDSLCVEEVTTVAGENCNCCFAAPEAEGCFEPSAPGGPNSVAECVCNSDSFCCTVRWDSLCVDEVESLGCGVCEPTVGMIVDDSNGTVTVFDTAQDLAVGSVTLPAGANEGDCSITQDLSVGFATAFQNEVWAIDPLSVSLAPSPNPIPIANKGEDSSLTADQQFLVVCDGSNVDPVSVIDVSTQTQVGTFATGADCNSVEVCSDGSVLVTSSTQGNVRRLLIDGAGNLTDTGEVLLVSDPNNVLCALSALAGVVVTRGTDQIVSFRIPGLIPVHTRNLSGAQGISGVIDDVRGRVYTRDNTGGSGFLEAFDFNTANGALGAAPLFSIPIDSATTYYGMDQLAMDPQRSKLYVARSDFVSVHSPITGGVMREIRFPEFVDPTGICLMPEPRVALQLGAGLVFLAGLAWRRRRSSR